MDWGPSPQTVDQPARTKFALNGSPSIGQIASGVASGKWQVLKNRNIKEKATIKSN